MVIELPSRTRFEFGRGDTSVFFIEIHRGNVLISYTFGKEYYNFRNILVMNYWKCKKETNWGHCAKYFQCTVIIKQERREKCRNIWRSCETIPVNILDETKDTPGSSNWNYFHWIIHGNTMVVIFIVWKDCQLSLGKCSLRVHGHENKVW